MGTENAFAAKRLLLLELVSSTLEETVPGDDDAQVVALADETGFIVCLDGKLDLLAVHFCDGGNRTHFHAHPE